MARRHTEGRPVSEEEYGRMPERIGRHFDRVRALLDERLERETEE